VSSILDAVNKDAERAGKQTLGSADTGSGDQPPGPGLRRFLPAVLVVLVGLSVGAMAARMLGGVASEPESLLTDKAIKRAATEQREAARDESAQPQRHRDKPGKAGAVAQADNPKESKKHAARQGKGSGAATDDSAAQVASENSAAPEIPAAPAAGATANASNTEPVAAAPVAGTPPVASMNPAAAPPVAAAAPTPPTPVGGNGAPVAAAPVPPVKPAAVPRLAVPANPLAANPGAIAAAAPPAAGSPVAAPPAAGSPVAAPPAGVVRGAAAPTAPVAAAPPAAFRMPPAGAPPVAGMPPAPRAGLPPHLPAVATQGTGPAVNGGAIRPGPVTPPAAVASAPAAAARPAPTASPSAAAAPAPHPAAGIAPGEAEEPQGEDTAVEPVSVPASSGTAAIVERPAGAPEITLMFILWAQAPAQRMASVRVGTGAVTIVHEGEFIEGMQVASIGADAVDFLWTGTTFRVHVGPF